jgi:hypothetical protein
MSNRLPLGLEGVAQFESSHHAGPVAAASGLEISHAKPKPDLDALIPELTLAKAALDPILCSLPSLTMTSTDFTATCASIPSFVLTVPIYSRYPTPSSLSLGRPKAMAPRIAFDPRILCRAV